jgi:ABC-type lipoprotein release transport system permease subunit
MGVKINTKQFFIDFLLVIVTLLLLVLMIMIIVIIKIINYLGMCLTEKRSSIKPTQKHNKTKMT